MSEVPAAPKGGVTPATKRVMNLAHFLKQSARRYGGEIGFVWGVPSCAAEAAKRAKPRDDDDDGEEPEKALIEATPRKALPSPKERRERPRSTGTVPSVPKPKDE